jgi:hypothetical protein
MKENTYNSHNEGTSTIRRAFGWIYLIRKFPAGSVQILDREMIDNTTSIFTEGHAYCSHDDTPRGDRVPGILTSDSDFTGLHGTWKLEFTQDTSRICIPKVINSGKIPNLKKISISKDNEITLPVGFKGLVCVGSIVINDKLRSQYETFITTSDVVVKSVSDVSVILDFSDA